MIRGPEELERESYLAPLDGTSPARHALVLVLVGLMLAGAVLQMR